MAVTLYVQAMNGDKAAGGKLVVLKVSAADLITPNGARERFQTRRSSDADGNAED